MKKVFKIMIALSILTAILISIATPAMAETANLLAGDGFKELLKSEFAETQEEITLKPNSDCIVPFGNETWNACFTSSTDQEIECRLNYNDGEPFVVIKRTASEQSYLLSNSFGITPGKTYKFSFDYRCTSKSGATVFYRLNLFGKQDMPDEGLGYTELGYSTSEDNKWKHVEIYCTIPKTQRYVNKAQLYFSLGTRSRELCIMNPSVEECSQDAVLWYDKGAVFEENLTMANAWCNRFEQYGYIIAHILQTNIPDSSRKDSVYEPVNGGTYTVIKALPEITEADASAVMILTQYKGTPAMLEAFTTAPGTLTTVSGTNIMTYTGENITIDDDADQYRAFYWKPGSIVPTTNSRISFGSIAAQG